MGKKLAFTICSINYLGQALALKNSFEKFNEGYIFKVGLVDKLETSKIPAKYLADLDIVEVHTININEFQDMCDRYDITELNTAVKPFYFDYFFENDKEIQTILYLDPDILFFDSIKVIEDGLKDNDIVLTPHFYTPIYDDKKQTEQQMFVNGIYNLGFLGLKRSENAKKMLNWWKIKLEKECYMDIQKGMFVDQLWCNMVPLYFDGVKIEKYPGINIAYWNLHERKVDEKDGKFFVNNYPLVFFHFSGIDLNNLFGISRWQNRFNLDNRLDLKPIFSIYKEVLDNLENEFYRQFNCYYIKPKEEEPKKSILKRILTSLSYRIYNFFENSPL